MTETGVPRASTRASEIIYIFSSQGEEQIEVSTEDALKLNRKQPHYRQKTNTKFKLGNVLFAASFKVLVPLLSLSLEACLNDGFSCW